VPESDIVVLSCEHASNAVPSRWRAYFSGAEELLAGHRGWDPGALELARDLAIALGVPLHIGEVTRLLVDLNRSLGHRALFSERSPTDPAVREELLQRYYHPYRQKVRESVANGREQRKRVLHLSVHSFTPILDGKLRDADIGILYDPSRVEERAFADVLAARLIERLPRRRVRRNAPYRGTSDGLVTALRQEFPAPGYIGLELEINQGLTTPSRDWHRLRIELLAAVVESLPSR